MAVTELAVLRLKPGVSVADDAELRTQLRFAKDTMEAYSRHPFYFLQDEDDSEVLYIVGGWESAEFHKDSFVPSPENAEQIRRLQDKLNRVETMYHVEIAPPAISDASPIVSIGRYYIYKDKLAEFRQAIDNSIQRIKQVAYPYKVSGGYSIDNPSCTKYNEFVLFSGWNDLKNQHGHLPGFDREDRYKTLLSNFTINNATPIRL
ncbi:hypothetical protein TRICI_001910 [Trichomonascus ciferrii]|uniref:ABM domain-containing protein n=1 Tax=Trichomonascus ciferrii TaxID=44093 RepID=A0A642V9C8_9ASCO|nr:hypothetical protein TRICI_001910 [Trichomonascus ciferrii]